MPCSNVEGTVEIPLGEYNRLRDVESDYIEAGEQYHKGQEYMAQELLNEIEHAGFNLSIGATADSKNVLKMVIGVLKQVVRRA